jgi:hypothetical protein
MVLVLSGAQPARFDCAVTVMRRKFGKDRAKLPINVSIVIAAFQRQEEFPAASIGRGEAGSL